MQIFPHSAGKKKEIYPSYMTRTAQFEGIEVEVDEAFDAIRDIPGLEGPEGPEAPCDGAPCDGAPCEDVQPVATEDDGLPDEVDDGPVGEDGPAEGGSEEVVEQAQEAVSDAQVAVEEAAAAVEELAQEVAEGGEAAEEAEGGEVTEIEIEIEDDDEKAEDIPEGEELLKEGEEGCSDAMPEENTPAIEEGGEAGKAEEGAGGEEGAPQTATITGTLEFAGSKDQFVRMAHLSPQNRKEVYNYWVALGLPHEWCKALTKNYE